MLILTAGLLSAALAAFLAKHCYDWGVKASALAGLKPGALSSGRLSPAVVRMRAVDHIHLPLTPVDLRAGGKVTSLVTGEIHQHGFSVCSVCKKVFEFFLRQTIPPTGHTAGKAYWE